MTERAVLSAAPRRFTSSKSAAYAPLDSAGGPAVRNCEGLRRTNGSTVPIHGVGSSTCCPAALSEGDQWPTAVLGTHCEAPNRPSSWRSAIIASAAAVPAATPCCSCGPSSTAARAAEYCAASDASRPDRVVAGRFGTVETRWARTRWAAVATAASWSARAEKRRVRRYGRKWCGSVALTAS